ncbi:MAG: phosphate/phosphite/phosphonate ABC transporter substrate-binding protein [Arenibacterium sp.]
MTAFLGMYDIPSLHAANDAFWHEIRSRLDKAPPQLNREDDVWDIWRAPDLVFAQTCGMPYRARLHGQVQLIGTPDYGLPDCPPGYYRSVLIARDIDDDDLTSYSGKTFAYNEPLSQSGWAGPMTHLASRNVSPANYLQTGAHAASAKAVSEGKADLAGIDALTWELLVEHGNIDGLKPIAFTEAVPGLPYITSLSMDADKVFDAVAQAIDALDKSLRAALHLNGLVRLPAEDYLAIPTPPPPPSG